MDPSQGDNSKKRKTSAGSGVSSPSAYSSRKLFDARKDVFVERYSEQDVNNAKPSEVNALCGENGQTATCARRAIDDYNKKNGTEYKLEKGGDSNAFCRLLDDGNIYVHLNCVASDPMKGRHTFFAELKFENEVFLVTMVVSLGNSDDNVEADSADHNCLFCTGLRHSLTMVFTGSLNMS